MVRESRCHVYIMASIWKDLAGGWRGPAVMRGIGESGFLTGLSPDSE
jgi:hypothetical protein